MCSRRFWNIWRLVFYLFLFLCHTSWPPSILPSLAFVEMYRGFWNITLLSVIIVVASPQWSSNRQREVCRWWEVVVIIIYFIMRVGGHWWAKQRGSVQPSVVICHGLSDRLRYAAGRTLCICFHEKPWEKMRENTKVFFIMGLNTWILYSLQTTWTCVSKILKLEGTPEDTKASAYFPKLIWEQLPISPRTMDEFLSFCTFFSLANT